jgi:hypothetical protein
LTKDVQFAKQDDGTVSMDKLGLQKKNRKAGQRRWRKWKKMEWNVSWTVEDVCEEAGRGSERVLLTYGPAKVQRDMAANAHDMSKDECVVDSMCLIADYARDAEDLGAASAAFATERMLEELNRICACNAMTQRLDTRKCPLERQKAIRLKDWEPLSVLFRCDSEFSCITTA